MDQDPTRYFTQEQLQALKEIFARADRDGDGAITHHELGSTLRSLGHDPQYLELMDLISAVDQNNSGEIDFPELVALVAARRGNSAPDDEMRDAFMLFDLDGDGYISGPELSQAMARLGERLSDTEVAEKLRRYDQDGDGRIDYAEFVAMMMQP